MPKTCTFLTFLKPGDSLKTPFSPFTYSPDPAYTIQAFNKFPITYSLDLIQIIFPIIIYKIR